MKIILKIILFFFVVSIFQQIEAKEKCFSFLPYGHNNLYVHLPLKKKFCTANEAEKIFYSTDELGGRYFNKSNEENIKVFGDSQVLGLEVSNYNNHYLSKFIKNPTIYAAPNNGPFEVINFLKLNKIANQKIVITFNSSVDFYRILPNWDFKNFVALNEDELKSVIKSPYKYKFIIFKNLVSNKNFTISRYDNPKMQQLFLQTTNKDIINYFNKYLIELNKIKKINSLNIDIIVSHPYWLYNKENNELILNNEVFNKYNELCEKIKNQLKNYNFNFKFSAPDVKLSYDKDLTSDKKHIISKKILFE